MPRLYPQLADARSLPRKKNDAPTAPVTTGVVQCLVMSCDERRRDMLYKAATSQGWRAIACKDGAKAIRESILQRVQLALIDLQSALTAQRQDLKRLVESLADRRDTLLVLCGGAGDPREEIWARELGVWMYLPDVDETSDVGSLCAEARRLTTPHLAPQGATEVREGPKT